MCNDNDSMVPAALKFFNENARELSANLIVNFYHVGMCVRSCLRAFMFGSPKTKLIHDKIYGQFTANSRYAVGNIAPMALKLFNENARELSANLIVN